MRRRCCKPPRLIAPEGASVPIRTPEGASVPIRTPEGASVPIRTPEGAFVRIRAPEFVRAGAPTALPGKIPPDAPARRTLALHLPLLAIERLRRTTKDLPPGPLACWAPAGNRRVLTAVDPAAAVAGLRLGQPLADARAILPGLTLHPADPAADAAWLRRLALWAQCVTPLPAVDPPDGLLLDVTGVAHLHGGEPALLRAVAARFARAGITVHAAMAGAPAAAAALARAGVKAIVPPGGEAAAIAPLPLAALRLPPETAAALSRLGLRRVGEVLRQPRGPLAKRFGPALWATLDAATGARPQPVRPLRPPAEFAATREPLDPIITREAIDATFAVLLREVCDALAAAGLGARRMLFRAFRVDGEVQVLAIGTGLPARDPAHFARLFRDRLETLQPDFGFQRLSLEARATRPFHAPQGEIQTTLPGRQGPSPEARRQALAELLDRLGQRLPVWRLAPRPSHWPDRAVARVGAFDPVPSLPGWPLRPRPLRLLRRPIPLLAIAALPDDPPSLLRAGHHVWRVRRAEGPERIEPEWWRDDPTEPTRDYFRVELAGGRRLWVYRADQRWFWHGHFA